MSNTNDKPLINVLIRTSNRPNGFKRLLESLEKQTYKNLRIIVSVDNDKTLEYVKEYIDPENIVEVTPDPNAGRSPHNLYVNELLEEVEDGFIIVIDDDDHVPNKQAFSKIYKKLEEDKLNVVRMRWPKCEPFPNGRIIPEDEYMEVKPFVRKHIGMPCLVYHAKYADKVKFDAHRAADFRAANQLGELLNVNMIDQVVVETGNIGKTSDPKGKWDIE